MSTTYYLAAATTETAELKALIVDTLELRPVSDSPTAALKNDDWWVTVTSENSSDFGYYSSLVKSDAFTLAQFVWQGKNDEAYAPQQDALLSLACEVFTKFSVSAAFEWENEDIILYQDGHGYRAGSENFADRLSSLFPSLELVDPESLEPNEID